MHRIVGSRTALRLFIALTILVVQVAGLVLTFSQARRLAADSMRDVVRSQVAATADALEYRFRDYIRELEAGLPACRGDSGIVIAGFRLTRERTLAGLEACGSAAAGGAGALVDAAEAAEFGDEPGVRLRVGPLTPELQYGALIDLSGGLPAAGYLVDLGRLLAIYVSEVRIGDIGSMWAATADGRVLWDIESEIIGSSLLELHADYPELLEVDRRILREPSGTGFYSFIHRADGRTVEKFAAWEHIRVGADTVPIVLSVSPEELSGGLTGAWIASTVLVGVSVLIIFGYFFHTMNRERREARDREEQLERLVAERTRRLTEQEAHFRTLFEAGGQAQILADAESGRVVDANSAAARLWERPREELIGTHQTELHPVSERTLASGSFQSVARQNDPTISRDRSVLTRSGAVVPVNILTTQVTIGDRRFVYGAFVDMSAERSRQRELQELAEERSRFLHEVVHRTKNNLALISSMLSLQAHSADDESTRRAFQSAEDRVRAMVELQTMLSVSESAEEVALDTYLERVARRLLESSSHAQDSITMSADMSPVTVSARLAVSLGLVVNELVTNALKYAFPGEQGGTLDIRLHPSPRAAVAHDASEEAWLLEVADSGIGLPDASLQADNDDPSSGSLGMVLIRGIVSQIGGSVVVSRDGGTRWSITFSPSVSV